MTRISLRRPDQAEREPGRRPRVGARSNSSITKVGGNWMMGFARLAFAGLLAIAATGLARGDEPQKAKVGVLRLSSSAPVFIAQDKGYFRDAGLDIELKFFDAAQPIAVATTSGD